MPHYVDTANYETEMNSHVGQQTAKTGREWLDIIWDQTTDKKLPSKNICVNNLDVLPTS